MQTGNNRFDKKPLACSYFSVLSNELGSPKILQCPANRLKKNAIATDWSTATTGLWNTSAQANGGTPVHRSEVNKYGKAAGYDASISYSILRSAMGERRGLRVADTPSYMLAFDYNVSIADSQDEQNQQGYPNFDPLDGGGFQMWSEQYRSYVTATSGISKQPREYRIDRLGFVVGQADAQRYEVHGNQKGHILFADSSILQVEVVDDFSKASHAMWQR